MSNSEEGFDVVEEAYKEIINDELLQYIEEACECLNDLKYLNDESTLEMKLVHLISTASENKKEFIDTIIISDIWELFYILQEVTSVDLHQLESGKYLENSMYSSILSIIESVYTEINSSNEVDDNLIPFMHDMIKIVAYNYVFKAELSEIWNNKSAIYKAKYEMEEYINNQSNKVTILSDVINNVVSNGKFIKDIDAMEDTYLDMEEIHNDLDIRASDIKKVDNEEVKLDGETKLTYLNIFSTSMKGLFRIIEDTERKVKESKYDGTNKIRLNLDDYSDIDEDFLEVVIGSAGKL